MYGNGNGNGIYNPYNNYQPKTPEQLKQEVDLAMNNYRNSYNQMQSGNVNINNANGGQYIYITSYEEVENTQVPATGVATLFIDGNNGKFYSKKFVNGQSYIQPFEFKALIKEGVPPVVEENDASISKTNTSIDIDKKFSSLEEKINTISSMLEKLNIKGEKDGTNIQGTNSKNDAK